MAGEGAGCELTERQRYWLGHIRGWERAGGSMKVYAEAHGLEVREFYEWKRWVAGKGLQGGEVPGGGPLFQRVEVEQIEAPVCRVEFPNGVRVELSGPLSATVLGVVFKAAGALP